MPMLKSDEHIVYNNTRNGLGVRILGTKRSTATSGIFIKQLLDGGLAQRDGRLQVGDQILSINDEVAIGISRKHAINILRAAAATNRVYLHVQHFYPPLSSIDFQQLLHSEKSTDDEEDYMQQVLNDSLNKSSSHNRSATTNIEDRIRRSGRKHHRTAEKEYRHDISNSSFENRNEEIKETRNEPIALGLDVSQDALQSLLNSKFKIIDLIPLLKKIQPNLFSNDQQREFEFFKQISQTNPDGRITLKDFERQSSFLLGERVNLLSPFYSTAKQSSTTYDNQYVAELQREITCFRSKIDELQTKITICEKSQRLSEKVELEYEDLLKFVHDKLHQYRLNEASYVRRLHESHQLIEKLFRYLSVYMNQSTDYPTLTQLKKDYERQKDTLLVNYEQTSSQDNLVLSNRKHQQRI